MSKEAPIKETCELCGRAVKQDGSRWVHADGKTYRHIIRVVPTRGEATKKRRGAT